MPNLRTLLPLFSLLAGITLSAGCLASQDLAKRFSAEAWQARRVHANVEVFSAGHGPERAYVFMPATPDLQALPLVLFHHGWLGMNPKNFGALIDLIVRSGAVVIYPVYQDGEQTSPQQVTELAARANALALKELESRNPGLVDRNRTLYWGFSMGASISLNLALQPTRYGLPEPRAMLLLAPGDAHHVARGDAARSILGPIEKLPAKQPVLIASGAADTSIGVPTARAITGRLCHLPASGRNLIFLPSDSHGERRIMAGHGSPGAPDSRYDFPDSRRPVASTIPGRQEFEASASLNLLDYYGYWRMTMRLLDYVAGQEYPTELFSRTADENRFLGYWPDGSPYAAAQLEDPCP